MFRGATSARRWALGVALSAAVHATVAGGGMAVLLLRGLSFDRGRVDVDIVGMRLDDIHDLPLGAPAVAEPRPARARPKARHHGPRPPDQAAGRLEVAPETARDRVGAAEGDDEPAQGDGPAPPKKLDEYGPQGSRLTVLLRLDRLRQTPYVPAVDAILRRLPDRQDLLEGTGLDLYQTFDALLIATPNPLDDSVTFLAARHHLTDDKVRKLLEAGARETGHVLTWHTEGDRPVAERRARAAPAGASHDARRDDRLVVLAAPGLVVVTPPVYRAMLLQPPQPVAETPGGDGGAEAAAGDGGAGAGPDAGVTRAGWARLLRRIDAEGGVMPPDAIAMLSAVDLFSARGLQRGLDSMSGPRRAPGGDPAAASSAGTARFMGMEVPRVLTVVVGAAPAPFLDVTVELADEGEARHWEESWPEMHRKLRLNPYVVLVGLSSLVGRAELTRDGSTIHLHQPATELETMRVLELVAQLMGPRR